MAKLAPSLVRLRDEIDLRWPHRDRRTDGWYRNPAVGISYGHNPDTLGNVHAIDVDRDGVDPDWIVANIRRTGGVLWYVIWNRRLWSNTYKWVPYDYHGKSPHTDHFHVEIYHTPAARGYSGSWNVHRPGQQTIGSAPGLSTQWGPADSLAEINLTGDAAKVAGDFTFGYGSQIANLRTR